MKKIVTLLSIIAVLALILAINPVATLARGVTCESDVTVQAEDTLSKIADKIFGNKLAFQAIADATNAMAATDSSYAKIEDVNVIKAGWKLCIPSKAVAEAALAAATPAAAPAAAPEKKFRVALAYGVKNDGFYITMEKGAQAMADKLGMEFTADGPDQFQATLQTPIVDAMIAKGIDALLIAATDKQAMVEPMKRAADAGIKVISVDTFIGDGDYVKGPVTFPLSYVGSDNTLGGKIACDALIQGMGGKGKIYIQNTTPGISTTDQRQQGCEEAIKATNGAVTLVGVDFNGDNAAVAAEQTAAVLQREPDLSAIFGTNLFSARGAAQAVKNAGLAGVVKVANFDAPEDAIVALRDGVVDMVIAQKPGDIGTIAVNYAYMALTGRESAIAKRVPTGYVVITRDNVDTPEAQAAIYKSQ
jgi:ribose transport system substrate-binding protein